MSYIGNEPTSVAFLTDTFSGNGSTTAFTLSAAPAGTSSILVAISGVVQDPSTYSVVGTTLTFSPAPPTGTGNISVRFLGIPASGVTTTAYRTVTEFTATAGQTSFSVPSYTPGFIDVYRNGVLLGSADYTASNGVSVVLASGATAGDLVEVISFSVSSVLNAIPGTAGSVGTTFLASASVTQAKLGAGVAGNGPAFAAFQSSPTSLSSGAFTKVLFGTEEFDTNNNFTSSTFTPTVAGYYQVNGAVNIDSITGLCIATIYKNGSRYKDGAWIPTAAQQTKSLVSSIVFCNGTTDYLEIYGFNGGSTTSTINTQVFGSFFNAALVRAA